MDMDGTDAAFIDFGSCVNVNDDLRRTLQSETTEIDNQIKFLQTSISTEESTCIQLNKDYSHDLRLIPNSEQIINTIETSIREPIRSMDSSNMEKCKKYIQLISTISAKYMQEKGL